MLQDIGSALALGVGFWCWLLVLCLITLTCIGKNSLGTTILCEIIQYRKDLEFVLETWYMEAASSKGAGVGEPKEIAIKRSFPTASQPRSERQRQQGRYKLRRNNDIKLLKLALKPHKQDNKLAKVPTISLNNFHEQRFPPANDWLSGASVSVLAEWHLYFANKKLTDDRPNRTKHLGKFIIDNDPNNWKLVVKADEGVIVRDSKTGEIVLMVIRNFCAESAVLEWANDIVGKCI
ncbi:hypothetical protein FN846DRAFT_889017 [Sphaerosporella brunnea]|uniref:Uncharacterized protein n=1 Tax=Sphaerosporella brunnea TaxID=1250544 RepID=A0A5J5F0I3_9PEZI|nr:hypothetical protein FN846DRAFT_889017 [Sphaerosporella brunnea]